MLLKNDVVQFNENHSWCGCLGIVEEVKLSKIMVGVPIPNNDDESRTAYIFCKASDVEVIGKAVLTIEDDEYEVIGKAVLTIGDDK